MLIKWFGEACGKDLGANLKKLPMDESGTMWVKKINNIHDVWKP